MPESSEQEDPIHIGNSVLSKMSKLKLFFSKWFSDAGKQPDLSMTELGNKFNLSNIGKEIINNIEMISDKTVEEAMIPRSDIVSVSIDASLAELSEAVITHTYTRILIHKERLDNIVGFVHIKDIFEVVAKSKSFHLKKLIRKHILAPHSMKLIDLLAKMQVNRTHIAVVVDEYGGTDGLVTIDNIIEEIVGRIDDEHDIGIDADYKILKPGLIITSSRVEIEELEEVIGSKLREVEDEFDTIGGLVMAKSGKVPEKGTIVNITEDIVAEILESTPRTIKQIKLTYTVK